MPATRPGRGGLAVARAERDRAAVEGGEMGAAAELQREAEDLCAEPDHLLQVVRRQDGHPYLRCLRFAHNRIQRRRRGGTVAGFR